MTDSGERGHLAVLGDSRVAKAIVRQEARRRPVVHGGAEPVPGAPGDAVREVRATDDPGTVLREAGAFEAHTVVVDLADDAGTLAAVAALLEDARPGDGRRPAIVANIRDAALRRLADDNLHALDVSPRPRLVSTAALSAAAAVAALRPYDLAYWRGQARMHAVVVGFSDLGREYLEELVQAGIAGDLGLPRVTVVDPRAEEVRKLLDRDMPEIGLSADIVVHPFDPLTLTGPGGPIATAEAQDPVTLIVVALDDPGAAIAAAIDIARAQEREARGLAACLVVTEGQVSLFELGRPPGRAGDLARSWSVFGGVERDEDVLGLLAGRADVLARRIHDAYRSRFGGAGAVASDWDELPETFRRSNRRAAAHLPVKLWTLGLREPGRSPDPFAVEPTTYANVIAPCATGRSEDALLRRLSRIEHDRWCAERRLDGWRFASVRDDARRLHPKLIPFDDPRFTQEDIEKDADQVRFLFSHVVAPAPDGAVTPLVVGLVPGTASHPAIDVQAALALRRRDPWRPVVVIAALLDETECRLLKALDEGLCREGIGWRLVVPELSYGNAELRVVIGAHETALLARFLQAPTTTFAPIGGTLAPADLWADPSAPDPHAQTILAYIVSRAAAVIGLDAPVAGVEPAG